MIPVPTLNWGLVGLTGPHTRRCGMVFSRCGPVKRWQEEATHGTTIKLPSVARMHARYTHLAKKVREMNDRGLYKSALKVLIGTVGLSAALGIYALLRQDLDEWSAKTLGTTLFVSAASLLIMLNAASLEKRSFGYLLISFAGVVAALTALPMLLYGLWLEVDNDRLWKPAASLEIISGFAAHSSLLSLRRPTARYRSLLPIATIIGGVLATLVIWMIWAEEYESVQLRAAGVLSILLLSVTIVTPILSRLAAIAEHGKSGGKTGHKVPHGVHHCPNCGRAVRSSGQKGRCTECGASFAVKFSARR